MRWRTWQFVATRPGVLLPSLIGLGMLLGHVGPVWSLGLFGLAALRARRLLDTPDLETRLRLRDEKRRHGIHRVLQERERDELLALDSYRQAMRERGADPKLGERLMAEAWELIRSLDPNEAGARLASLRHSLPPLGEPERSADGGLAAQIEKELWLLHAAERELESIGAARMLHPS